MPIRLPDGRTSLKTVLINRANDKDEPLFERPGSRCHFTQRIEHNGYLIYLRIDWGDLEFGDPMLDADVYEMNPNETKGKRVPNKSGNWHHTMISPIDPDDMRAYVFCFEDLKLELIARKTFELSAGLSVNIADGPDNLP